MCVYVESCCDDCVEAGVVALYARGWNAAVSRSICLAMFTVLRIFCANWVLLIWRFATSAVQGTWKIWLSCRRKRTATSPGSLIHALSVTTSWVRLRDAVFHSRLRRMHHMPTIAIDDPGRLSVSLSVRHADLLCKHGCTDQGPDSGFDAAFDKLLWPFVCSSYQCVVPGI